MPADTQLEARHILLTAAAGIIDRHLLWAVGAHFAWHVVDLARIWNSGLVVESTPGSTLSGHRRWRTINADRRKAVLIGSGDVEVAVVRLADVAQLVARPRLPERLVGEIRTAVAEHYAPRPVGWTEEGAALQRRCRQLASQAWDHVRPADTLFDLPGTSR